ACEGAELSHGELDARASRLARALMRLGVGPESFVAIALSKSIEMVVAVVAVLKSGGAYVPLDPTHPPERLAELLDDFRPRVLLTEEGLLPAFASLALAQAPAVLAVDAPSWGADGAAEPSGESFAVAVEPGWLAYMIYTSGSTGKPKGVMNTHGAIAARIATLAERHRLGPEDRQLQFASLTFDMSCEEMFPVLVAGGAVVLQPRPGQLRPLEVLDAAERQGVTKVTFPSSYCHQLVDELVAAGRRWPASIRFLATGAEAPSREKFAELSGLADRPVECWNYYGPTETTIIVCGSRIPLGTGEALPERFTIGVPLPGCHLYVLDRRLAPQPLTVAGE
ncbi:MAG TPA: AMP-binding protein, partial [Thermoanaerobaculia bacterium]|nr:AMP-binding protein [Thermoanaerobaculia bacterium]